MRAGRYVKQPEHYRAFIPAPLPPDPPIQVDSELTKVLSDADRALGRLDGVATMLPSPDLFVAMYVRLPNRGDTEHTGRRAGIRNQRRR